MSAQPSLIPTSSQTVGPFFRIGLEYLIAHPPAPDQSSSIAIHGRVLERDGAPVPDAMLEFWSPHIPSAPHAFPHGFRRAATGLGGEFSVTIQRPAQNHPNPAPHLLVLVFARGLLRHLISRVYFEHEAANTIDSVLSTVPVERRRTLIAHQEAPGSFRWDVILQGDNETVFFAW